MEQMADHVRAWVLRREGAPCAYLDKAEACTGGFAPVSDYLRSRLPFGCPFCRKRFRHKGDLRQHRRGVHLAAARPGAK